MDRSFSDLHIHTLQSVDGQSSVNSVLSAAVENNITNISITDHNNINNTKKALRLAKKEPFSLLNIIPGVEITCRHPKVKGSMHVLLYNFDVNNIELNALLAKINEQERVRKYDLLKKFEVILGIEFNRFSVVKKLAHLNQISQKDVARILHHHLEQESREPISKKEVYKFVNSVIVSGKNEKNQPSHMKLFPSAETLSKKTHNIKYPGFNEIVDVAKNSGGILSIAHPNYIEFKNKSSSWKFAYTNLLEEIKKTTQKNNLPAAIECLHPSSMKNKPRMGLNYKKHVHLASKMGFLISGGSDTHAKPANVLNKVGNIVGKKIEGTSIIDFIKGNKRPPRVSLDNFEELHDRPTTTKSSKLKGEKAVLPINTIRNHFKEELNKRKILLSLEPQISNSLKKIINKLDTEISPDKDLTKLSSLITDYKKTLSSLNIKTSFEDSFLSKKLEYINTILDELKYYKQRSQNLNSESLQR